MSESTVDILIVGAGFAGAATAYHLSRQTSAGILIVEQEAVPGVHSSGRNAAIVRQYADDPALQGLLDEGAGVLRRGGLARFDRRGVFMIGSGEEPVQALFPRARGMGRWYGDDGTVDVAGLLQTYLRGQTVRFSTKVQAWKHDAGGLRVTTSGGDIQCGLLVNAAGPWAGRLGALPLEPLNRHLFVTGDLDWIDPGWPCVWDGTRGLYFRPESGGLLLSCCDESPAAPGDYREDPSVRDALAERLAALQPGLGELSLRKSWVGQRVFASDRRFVIGFDPRDDKVFHVAGLGGHGVTASYAIGRLAAGLIAARGAEHSAAFSPERLLT